MNYRVLRIEEDVDFGCEERKEGDPVMAVVRLEDEDGDVKIVRQRDQMLYDRDINEGDRVWFDERQELVKRDIACMDERLAAQTKARTDPVRSDNRWQRQAELSVNCN